MIHFKRIIAILLILSIVFFVWLDLEQRTFIQTQSVQEAALPQVGFQAPDFTLETLNTELEITLSETIPSKTGTILYFWTSWCPFCAASMEALESGHQEYGSNVNFIGINVTSQDTMNAAKNFMEKHNVSFQNVMDIEGATSSTYFVPPVPTTVFIDQDGIITYRKVGGVTKQDIEQGIQQLGGRRK